MYNLLIFSAFPSFPPCLCVCLTSTMFINSSTLHMICTTHTHTRIPLKTEEPKVAQTMDPWIHMQKTQPTHHMSDDKKYFQNSSIPSYSYPITQTQYHHNVTQQQQFLWHSTAYTQVQVEYNIQPAPILTNHSGYQYTIWELNYW